MLSFPAAIKVYLCTIPCDLRRSFDGLSMMAEHLIPCNPFSGHLLVFCNRRSDRVSRAPSSGNLSTNGVMGMAGLYRRFRQEGGAQTSGIPGTIHNFCILGLDISR
jgi:IS66 Orf2 like protein